MLQRSKRQLEDMKRFSALFHVKLKKTKQNTEAVGEPAASIPLRCTVVCRTHLIRPEINDDIEMKGQKTVRLNMEEGDLLLTRPFFVIDKTVRL